MSVRDPLDLQVEVEEDTPARSAAPGLARIWEPRDLIVPVLCAAVILLLVRNLRGRELDRIESLALDFDDRIRPAVIEHIYLSFTIAILVIAIAVPLGVLVTRRRTAWLAPVVLGLGNIGQAAPSVGLIAIIGLYFTGFWAVVGILTGYAALSVIRNTIVGIQGVDPGVLDAAKGMGLSPVGVLFRVELPLAVPIIAAGARTALVLAVATVPFGENLNAGGLGDQLFGGIKLDRPTIVFTGALLVAVLALLLDWFASICQRLLTPRGIR